MAQNNDPAVDRLARVIQVRQRQFAMRVLTAAVIGGLFFGFTGWPFAALWFAAYVALQLVERRIFSAADPVQFLASRFNYQIILVLLSANTLVFGAFGLGEAIAGGPWGLTCGCLLWAGSIMNSVVVCNGSRDAFLHQAAPSAVFYLLTPVVALTFGAPPLNAAAVIVGGGLNLAVAASVWASSQRLFLAEWGARNELEREKQQALASTASKSALVAMVSHELRTPISAIMAGAAQIEQTAGDVALQSNGRLIAQSARMMRTLLNDLLDLSKIEAGCMTVEIIPFDLRRFILDTVRFWNKEAAAKGLRMRLLGAHSLPQWVMGDPMRLRQILNNLLSNACKFTQSGSITLAFHALLGGGGAITLGLSVHDTGPGLTSEQLSRLFEAFEQLQSSTARTHGGTGLGLAISRDLAQLMQGELSATSVDGQGATFTLALPMALAAPPLLLEAPSPAEASRSSEPPIRVLIADDHEFNRRAFALMLQGAHVETTLVEDGQQALDVLATQGFDVVMMDVNMPKMGGLEAVRRLRTSRSPNAAVPVIALTAAGGADDLAACLAAGMDAFVCKPVESAELFAAIDSVLNGAAPATVKARSA